MNGRILIFLFLACGTITEPICTEESCAYCNLADETNAVEPLPYCKICANGLIIQFDETDGDSQGILGGGTGHSGHCAKGLRISNCYQAPANDNTRCEICDRGYYLNKGQDECLDMDDTNIENCVVAHEDENGWGVICDACDGRMVSPDGKYCINEIAVPDNCEFGGRMGTMISGLGGYATDIQTYSDRFGMEPNNLILGEHLPCFLCGQRFYEKNGRCEWSYIEGCKVVDELNGMCLECNAFKGFYSIDAYFMGGFVYQICSFRTFDMNLWGYLWALILLWVIY